MKSSPRSKNLLRASVVRGAVLLALSATCVLPLAHAAAPATSLGTVDLSPGADAGGAFSNLPQSYALNPVSHKLYVLGYAGTVVSRAGLKVIDTTTGAVRGGVALTSNVIDQDTDTIRPYGVTLDASTTPGGNLVYVVGPTNSYQRASIVRVRFIDGATDTALTDASSDLVVTGAVGFGRAFANPLTHNLYVADNNNQIFVVDGPNRRVLTSFSAPSEPFIFLHNPNANAIYLLGDNAKLGRIDGATNATSSVALGIQNIKSAALDPATNRIYAIGYVPDSSNPSTPATLAVLDATTGAILASTPAGFDVNTDNSIALDAAGGTVYVSSGQYNVGQIKGYDTASLGFKGAYNHPARYLAADAGRLFLQGGSYEIQNAVGVVDTNTGLFSKTTVSAQPGAVALNPALSRVYVSDDGTNEVQVIDAASRAVVSRFPVSVATPNGAAPRDLAVSATLNRFYLTHLAYKAIPNSIGSTNDAFLDVYDGADGHLIRSVELGADAFAGLGSIAVDDSLGRIYVSGGATVNGVQGNALFVLDQVSHAILATIPNAGGTHIAANPLTHRIYATQGSGIGEGKVTVTNGSTNTVIATVSDIGSSPNHLAINTRTNKIYVNDNTDGTVDGNNIFIIDGTNNTYAGSFSNTAENGTDAVSNLAVDEAANVLYLGDNANQFKTNGYITAFDLSGNASLGETTVGVYPAGMVFDPATRRVFAAIGEEGTVSVLQAGAAPPVGPAPDLTGSLDGLKINLKSNGSYKIKGTYTLSNAGAVKAKKINVAVYLSMNATVSTPVSLGGADLLPVPVTLTTVDANGNPLAAPRLGLDAANIGSPTVAPLVLPGKLKPGVSESVSFVFKVPAAAVALAGSTPYRYLLVVADPNNAIAEQNENNNVLTVDLNDAVPK